MSVWTEGKGEDEEGERHQQSLSGDNELFISSTRVNVKINKKAEIFLEKCLTRTLTNEEEFFRRHVKNKYERNVKIKSTLAPEVYIERQ